MSNNNIGISSKRFKFKSISMLIAAAMMMPLAASAQNYPERPIRMLATEVGGASDIAARLVSQYAAPMLGQSVVMDNHPGVISIETAAKAPPDGYTLLFYGGTLWLLPFMRDSVPWDPVRDFAPVTIAVSSPLLLVTNPSLPVKSVNEFLALARAQPGKLNYATSGSGSATHLAAELFKSMAKLNIVRVSYKGSGIALNALVSNEVQLMFATKSSVDSYVKSGRLKALAVSSAKPSALAPGVPTISASGLPGYECISVLGLFAPAKTPPAIIQKLNKDYTSALAQQELKEKFFKIGVETWGSTSEEAASVMKREMARMGKVIKEADIHAD